MTDEQKATISKNSKRIANDGRNLIYCYDIETKLTHVAVSLPYLSKNLFHHKVGTGSVRNILTEWIQNLIKQFLLQRALSSVI